ncbi:flavin monoamine oxidase family protein [Mycoplana dimorpha]|uniref:Tryptophan 2-monooxygenase n=1 Tax=Mycoplana dimorpha TaxID=28320 RepID=A0A2T5AR17_MYCDI|nr:NAD(P)/FAD-dependent oxidoreductase [Mycoplana dimorpha]PTM89149.1 monoamine oxidase [Mycoplana dimorpha]
MKFLVAGGGLAGLNAAWELKKKGHEVILLEANSRVGGRCWSEELPNGEIIEHGGEFISVFDHTIRAICAEFRLPIVGLGIPFDRRHQVDGSFPKSEELTETMAKMSDAAARLVKNGYGASLRDVAREAFGPDYESLPYCQKLFATTTCDPDLINGYAVAGKMQREGYEYVEHRGRVKQGNDAIAKEIERRLGDSVRLNMPVTRVTNTDAVVTMETANGESFSADRAIIAVPLPILQQLIDTLDLPADMVKAIKGRQMGAAAKLNIMVSGDAPPRGVQAPNAPWWSWTTADNGGDKQRGALTAYAGGKKTMSTLSLENGAQVWLEKVRNYRTDVTVSDDYILTNWAEQPFTKGAYSMPGLDWEPELDGVFNQAAGNIAFAGEHTHFASLNGALESGARAAKLLTLI